MAKGNMLLGKARGKVGSLVYSVLKGQQITRPLNDSPSNPRTPKQSIQRARFAAAVKFFTRGNQKFYKFAYENKKQVESDYNAFMRENVRRAPAISREAFNNYDYPVFAPWLMAKGTLPPIDNSIFNNKITAAFNVPVTEPYPTTVGQLSAVLIENDAYQAGDIITLLTINSNYDGTYPSAQAEGSGKPQWTIRQIILDTTSTTTLEDALGMQSGEGEQGLVLTDLPEETLLNGTYGAFVCVHSRNTSSGLKTSTQELVLNPAAATAYDAAYEEGYKSAVIASWQAEGSVDAQPEAILQGSIAYNQQ